jgi:hypothetical protein
LKLFSKYVYILIRLIEYLSIYYLSGLNKNHISICHLSKRHNHIVNLWSIYVVAFMINLMLCTGYKRIPHFMAVDSATKSLPALSIWRNSLLFMFIFVYYSAWNIPFEHLHLCIPRCDQTLIYKHLCIPRCIVYPLNIYISTIYQKVAIICR